MKEQAFNGNDSTFKIKFLTEVKQACNSSRIHEGVTVWVFWELMSGPTLAAIIAPLTLLSGDVYKHERASTFYAGSLNHLLGR